MIYISVRFAFIALLTFGNSIPLWADEAKGFQINGKPVPNIVATVNGTNITSEFIKNKIETWRLSSKQQEKQITPVQEENFIHDSIHKAIEQELLYQKAKELNIKVETKTIQEEIDNLQSKFPNYKMFLAALTFQRLSLEKLAEKIEKKLTEDEIIRREIAPYANVTDNEVKAYYNQHKDSFIEPKKYQISHIFTAKVNTGNQRKIENHEFRNKADRMIKIINNEAHQKITLVLQKLRDGADFFEMVNQFSEDESTKPKGGNIGEIYLYQIDPVFAAVISRLDKGSISEVVEHKDGFHIFKLIHVKPEKRLALKDTETNILNSLLRLDVEKKKHEYISKLKKIANIKIFFDLKFPTTTM